MWYRASSKVEAPAAPSYMTYLASKSVIEYFSIGKRRELVKKIPSLRRVNARIPFHFDKVSLYYDNFSYRMKLDDVEWILKSEQTRLFGTVETVVNGTTTVKDFRLLFSYVDQLMKAYLNGNGRIRELSIVRFPHLPKHKVIGRLEMQFWGSTPLVDELANVQCNHAVLKSLEPTPDDFYEELKVRNLEISEPRTTFEKFRRMCRQLKEGNRHELGSFYQSEYEGFVRFVNEFWEELKGELHGEMWYNDSFTSKMANEKYKLLVTRKTDYNGRQDNFLFRVEIAELRIEDHLTANLRIFCNLEEHYIGKTIWILILYPFIIWNLPSIFAFVLHLISTISLSSTKLIETWLPIKMFSFLTYSLRAEIVDYGTGLNMKNWKFANLDRDYRRSLYLILIVYPLVIRNIIPITAFFSHSISTSTLCDYLSNSPRFLFIGHETYCQFQNLYLEWTARPRKTRLELTIATAFVPAFLITYSYLNITISEIISSLL